MPQAAPVISTAARPASTGQNGAMSRRALFAAAVALPVTTTFALPAAGFAAPAMPDESKFWRCYAEWKAATAAFDDEDDDSDAAYSWHGARVYEAMMACAATSIYTMRAFALKLDMLIDHAEAVIPAKGYTVRDVLVWDAERIAMREYMA